MKKITKKKTRTKDKTSDPRQIKSIEIKLWNKVVGFLAETSEGLSFEYEEEFKNNHWEISPFELSLATTSIYTSPRIGPTFKGLPGIMADCLPDVFGQKVIDNYFFHHFGIPSNEITPIMSLAYISNRSIGALEFVPNMTINNLDQNDILSLSKLVDAAKKTLEGKSDDVIAEIMKVGASAGGIKAKAVIDYNPDTHQIRSGFNKTKIGFIPSIIKFDGVTEGDYAGYNGKSEYIYNLIAADCGIRVSRSFLIHGAAIENGELPAVHFVTERFDRDEEKNKPSHVSTYCGLSLSDYRIKNSSSYENFLRFTKGLCVNDMTQVEQALKRCVFNVVMKNEDDHTKNFSFLMDQQGIWTLSPAYDLTYVRVKNGHQMSIHNKNQNFNKDDLISLGKSADIKSHKTMQIIEEVELSAKRFLEFAEEIALPMDFAQGIKRNFQFLL